MIIFKNIYRSFGENSVLEDLTFSLDGGIHALIGKSGTGKTTALRIIAGLSEPDRGTCTADAPISVSFQEDRLLPWYSAKKNVSLVSDSQTAELILSQLGLRDDIDKKPDELSGGMKKRVSLARALAADAKTVLLDEPFAGLDDETAHMALDVIRRHSEGKTVLISTHNTALAEKMDSIIRISEG